MRALTQPLFALLLAALFGIFSEAGADVAVKGYTRKDGTYVAPHMRSSPNGTTADNWSTSGNVNPYTGKVGTKPASDGVLVNSSNSATFETPPTAQIYSASNAAGALTHLAAAAPATSSDLETRMALLEAKIARLEALLLTGRATQAQTQQPPTAAGRPSLDQWRKIKNQMPMSSVESTLGKPAKIINRGGGERWEYEGGGWVTFIGLPSGQFVYDFGGYSF